MTKEHITLTVDSDILLWARNNLKDNAGISHSVNSYLRAIMSQDENVTEEEHELKGQLTELKKCSLKIQKNIQDVIIKMQIIQEREQEQLKQNREETKEDLKKIKAFQNNDSWKVQGDW